MVRLTFEELQVSSFDTTATQSLSGPVPVDTQQVDCWSPLCVPTYQANCPQTG